MQYLQFSLDGLVSIAFGVDHPEVKAESSLMDDQRAAIAEDFAVTGIQDSKAES